MLHTNHGELLRIFTPSESQAGGLATLTTSTEGGVLKLDIQLGPPIAACPGALLLHLQRPTTWALTSFLLQHQATLEPEVVCIAAAVAI